MVDFLHFTQANSVMLMSKAQIFEKAVQKISLNRLIHRKTWDTTENSLEKRGFQQKLVGKMCKDAKLVGVATHTQ